MLSIMQSNKIWLKLLIVVLIQIKMIAMEPAWHEANEGKRFLIDMEQKYNWYQAWNECARYDAQLVAIDNEEKNLIVMKLIKDLHGKNKSLWIGGNAFYNTISFHWATTEQDFTYTNWATDDVEKFAFKKQCVYLMRYRKNFPWSIANCEAKEFGFICEEMAASEEVEDIESIRKSESRKGSMYNGSIYGLIG